MTKLFWQPPPVTRCWECFYSRVSCGGRFCSALPNNRSSEGMHKLFEQNKEGITETCPMWQEQNKEEK